MNWRSPNPDFWIAVLGCVLSLAGLVATLIR